MNARGLLHTLTYGIFAKAPVSYAPTTGFSGRTGGVQGPSSAPESVSTLYSIIDLLGTSTARVGWELYRKTPDNRRVYGPREDNRAQVVSHPALSLLNNPNPLMTRNEFIERTQKSIDVTGEAFIAVEYVGSMPTELWPIRSDRMEPSFSVFGELSGWVYQAGSEKVPFELNEIIHIQTPGLDSIIRGSSPVKSLMIPLASMRAADQFNLAFFRTGALPGGFVKVPGSLEDDEFRRLQLQWQEQHQGVSNAHRVSFLENGMEWQDAAMSMLDMQFAELQSAARDRIREAYRIHPHMLGQSTDVNLANATAASIDFATWSLIPRLERLEQAWNGQLLPLFGDLGKGYEFCFVDPVPCDPEQENAERASKVDAVVKLAGIGFDPPALLAAYGLPDVPWTKPEAPAPPPVADPVPAPVDSIEAHLRAIMNLSDPRKAVAR